MTMRFKISARCDGKDQDVVFADTRGTAEAVAENFESNDCIEIEISELPGDAVAT